MKSELYWFRGGVATLHHLRAMLKNCHSFSKLCLGLSGFISLLRQADIVVHLLIDNFNVLCEESQPCYSDLIAETFAYLFSGNKSISLYACDCSKEALERAKENIEAANINLAKERFYPFQCDFSASRFPNWLACTACRENFFQKQSMCISGQ